MTWSCRGEWKERRWGRALWCVYVSIFMGPASLDTLLLWERTFTGSAHVHGSATLECGAALISSYAPMGQVPVFGATTLLTFPAPFSSPVFSVNFSVELLACGLTLMLQLIQVFVTSSSCEYRAIVALWRTFVVSFAGREVWFHLGGE